MDMTADIFAAGFRPEPCWWDDIPRDDAAGLPAAALPSRADVVVIGSGYAGLHAAISLARMGSDVVVVEAGPLGFGASTRNGGMVSGGVNVGKHASIKGAQADAMLAEAAESYSWFENFIRDEGIDAVYQRCGRFVGAHCKAAWQRQVDQLARLNDIASSGASMVPPERTRDHLDTAFYHGGMLLDRSGAVHPAKLHHGVLGVAAAAGVRLFGNVRAGRITRAGTGLSVETSQHAIRADSVIIATNGYSGDLSPWHRRRVVPVPSYQIATEQLGAARVTELFPTHRMIADTKRLLFYFRPSPDRRRVLFGGRARYLRHDPEAGARHLHARLLRIFPQLDGVRLSHGWWGNVAYLKDGVPHLGESRPQTLPGVFHALGCHGSGVVMMSWLGHRTGLMAAGRLNSDSAFSGRRLGAFPGYRGTPWFLPLVGRYYQLRDWLERRRDGRA
jgi:glycine/D-amino acid oxidase-like deaminating enzyme